MISETGSVDAMLRPPAFASFGHANTIDHSRLDRLDPMQNQLCRVCEEPAAGFHFGAFTCEGCKSFFGRTCNNQSVIAECKNNYRCVVDKKNRTACKACRLRKCLMVGMSKSGSRYGRRSNWFKIHCLLQQQQQHQQRGGKASPPPECHPPRSASPPTLVRTSTTSGLWRPQEDVSPRSTRSEHSAVPRTLGGHESRSMNGSSPSHSPPSTLSFDPHSLQMAPQFASPFPMVLPPTFNLPALAQLPLHKQMLLSPLLASSHVMQAAAMAAMAAATRNAAANSSLPPAAPTPHSMLLQQHQEQLQHLSLLAEHRALLERFRSLSGAVQEDRKAQDVGMLRVVGGHPIDLSAKRSSSSSPPRHDHHEGKPGSSPAASSSSSFQTFPNLSDSDEEPDEKEKQDAE